MSRRVLTALMCSLCVALFFGAPAKARELPLRDATCIGGAASQVLARELVAEALDCDIGRFDRTDRFLRASTDLADITLPTGSELFWQSDPGAFDTLILQFLYADGSTRIVDVDRQMGVRNWRAGSRFTVPLPTKEAPLVRIDAVAERPRSHALLRDQRLVDAETADAAHFTRALTYMLACGLLLVPIIYTLLFYRIFQARFMLWHVGLCAALMVFTLSSSGLIFLAWPDLPLLLRWQMNTFSFTVAVVCAVFFLIGLLEDGVLPRICERLLLASLVPLVGFELISLLDLEAMRMFGERLYLLAFVPVGVGLVLALVAALRAHSRAAVYLVAGFSGPIIMGMLVLLSEIGLLDFGYGLEAILVVAMVVLVLATSAGVGDRFMVLVSHLERAKSQAARMGQMAHTDGLTGLANRRAFGAMDCLQSGFGLLLLDLDHFKVINDRHGHLAGDAVLCHVARLIREALDDRPRARAYRLGGEEFVIVARFADETEMRELAEALRARIDNHASLAIGTEIQSVTISIGATMGQGEPMEQAFARADRALYRAKNGGRNRVAIDRASEGEESAEGFAEAMPAG